MAAAPASPRTPLATSLLREQALDALRRRTCARPNRLAADLAPVWERGRQPSGLEVAVVLTDVPGVHTLPDGRLVHLGAALEDRVLTTPAASPLIAAGLLPIDPDLAPAVLPYGSWARIPIRHGRMRGLAERTVTRRGAAVLALHPRLLPAATTELIAVCPGPEGLRLSAADPDVRATAALARALRPPGGSQGRSGADASAGWSPQDRLLLALVTDDGLCRDPAAPIGQLRQPMTGHGVASVQPAA